MDIYPQSDDLCRITLNSRACISRTCESPNLVTSHSFVCFAVTLKQLPEELVRFRILRLDGQILRNMSAIEVCERETSAHPRGTRHQTNQQEQRPAYLLASSYSLASKYSLANRNPLSGLCRNTDPGSAHTPSQ